jgi:hypothetical protein
MTTERKPGLYRTLLPLPGNEANVPGQRLVLFNPTSEANVPVVAMPSGVEDNRWNFSPRGYPVRDPAWVDTLVELPLQGFYVLTGELVLSPQITLPKGVLVQLGFTQQGEGVVFPAYLEKGNRIQFDRNGAKVSDLQFALFGPTEFRLLARPGGPESGAPPAGNANPDKPEPGNVH